MSQPQGDVATYFAAHFFCAGRIPQLFVATNFLISSFSLGRDLKLMSRLQFLLLRSSSGRDLNEWSRHRLRSLIIKWSQLQFLVRTLFGFFPGCDLLFCS